MTHGPAQAGGHLGVGAEPAVPAGRHRRLLRARPSSTTSSPRRPTRSAAAVDRGAIVADRLHRGAPVAQARSRRAGCSTRSSSSTTACSPSSPTRNARRVGVHTCPGGDQDSTHSADVDYAALLPALFRLERRQVLRAARQRSRSGAGARDPRRARHRQPADLRRRDRPDRPAGRDAGGGPRPRARGGPVHRPGPPRHDRRLRLLAVRRRRSTSRDTAFAKIRARIIGTAMASDQLGV